MTTLVIIGDVAFFIAGGASVWFWPKIKAWIAGKAAAAEADIKSKL